MAYITWISEQTQDHLLKQFHNFYCVWLPTTTVPTMACADVSYSLVMTHHGEKALKKKLPEILTTPKQWGLLDKLQTA